MPGGLPAVRAGMGAPSPATLQSFHLGSSPAGSWPKNEQACGAEASPSQTRAVAPPRSALFNGAPRAIHPRSSFARAQLARAGLFFWCPFFLSYLHRILPSAPASPLPRPARAIPAAIRSYRCISLTGPAPRNPGARSLHARARGSMALPKVSEGSRRAIARPNRAPRSRINTPFLPPQLLHVLLPLLVAAVAVRAQMIVAPLGAPGPAMTAIDATIAFPVTNNATQNQSSIPSALDLLLASTSQHWSFQAVQAKSLAATASSWSSAFGYHFNVTVSLVSPSAPPFRAWLPRLRLAPNGMASGCGHPSDQASCTPAALPDQQQQRQSIRVTRPAGPGPHPASPPTPPLPPPRPLRAGGALQRALPVGAALPAGARLPGPRPPQRLRGHHVARAPGRQPALRPEDG